MKKIILILLLHGFGLTLFAQNLLIANNNPGAATGVNVYTGATALQDALAAATTTAPYDIIYVVPSLVAYGAVTIDRGITIYGIGIRPAKDLSARSLVGPITVQSSNVRISGIIGPSNGGIFLGFGASNDTYTNIVVENSKFREIRQTNDATLMLDQLLVRNNIITNDGWWGVEMYVTSNATFTNNVIYCDRNGGSVFGRVLNFSNNLFVSNGNSSYGAIAEVDNCIFKHNIFFGANVNLTSVSTANVWDDNLSFGTSDDLFDVGLYANTSNSPNIESSDPLFANMALNITWSDAHDFTLQPGSPAINVNGTDIGPSGGPVPFNYEGNLLPLIQQISIPAVIPVGTDLPVTIKAKGN